ncbi:unnamed protein product [Psylliodes chrysocephalus]|uniref:Uncharacterized protein n=1 Tax=Psylliodes chrysocephalus TaxID=3402493 RepID=A0A9P0CTS1_9CUCU|nr:unnamed protein product [Psylliodes chrysocephala]
MKWNRKWYYGTVLDKERVPSCVDSSDDDVPLIKIAENLRNQVTSGIEKQAEHQITILESGTETDDPADDISSHYDSDADPPFGICQIKRCSLEIFAACYRCEILMCFNHFMEVINNCKYHGKGFISLKTDLPKEGVDHLPTKENIDKENINPVPGDVQNVTSNKMITKDAGIVTE